MSKNQEEITRKGNPARPTGQDGFDMLARMNESHNEVTHWALSFYTYTGNEKALDIGCGGGNTLRLLSQHVEHLVGVDYSEVSVSSSLEYNADLVKQGRLSVRHASVESLPFSDSVFDKIITVESFYFWPDPLNNLKEVRRVLKSNGTFLMVCDIYQKAGLSKAVLSNIKRYDLFITDPKGYKKLFEEAGFADVAVHTKPETDWICVEAKA